MEQKRSSRYHMNGVLLTLAGGVCWGFSGACGQFIMQHRGVDAGWLVSIRMLIAGSLLLVFSAVQARSIGAVTRVWTKKSSALQLLAFGVLGMAMCQLTYFVTIVEMGDTVQAEAAFHSYTSAVDALYETLAPKLREQNMWELFETIELPLCLVLAEMEVEGFLIDRKALAEFGEVLAERIETVDEVMAELAGVV